jgi:ribosomal protein L11 methyltransferase
MIALRFEVPATARETVERCCEDWGESLSLTERDGGACWAIEVLFAAAPDEASVRNRLGAAGVIDWRLEPVPERDWVKESQHLLPEFRAGRFFIYGSHFDGALPASVWALKIDAGTAFGTGRHQTTLGCLMDIERLRRRGGFGSVLDMGSGTGILALAAARAGARHVTAVDNDSIAVLVTRENARINALASRVRASGGEGYRRCPLARTRQRYDLVLANILSRPLQRMAPDLKRVLRPGGRAIVSGLLRHQEAEVIAAHRAQGLVLEKRRLLGEWSVLQFKRKTGGR